MYDLRKIGNVSPYLSEVPIESEKVLNNFMLLKNCVQSFIQILSSVLMNDKMIDTEMSKASEMLGGSLEDFAMKVQSLYRDDETNEIRIGLTLHHVHTFQKYGFSNLLSFLTMAIELYNKLMKHPDVPKIENRDSGKANQ